MQEEVAKHLRKINKTIKHSNFSFRKKVGEIALEIFIIVFAVTLSIGLHSWSQHRHQQKEVKEFLSDLKDDLKNDIQNMDIQSNTLSKALKDYTFLKSLTESEIDSLHEGSFSISMSYILRKTSIGNYEGFKSSGKIGFIENKKIKKLILEYFQEDMPVLDELELKYNSQLDRLMILRTQNDENKRLLLSLTFKKNIDYFIQLTESNREAYKVFKKHAEQIIDEINRQYKE